MAYVLLPRVSRRLRIGARSPIQSAHSTGNESGPPTSTNAQVHSNTAHVSDSDDASASMSDDSPNAGYTSDSDYFGSNKNTTGSQIHLDKRELFAKSIGRKRSREDYDYDDEDGIANNLEALVRGEAKRRRRRRKTDSEQNDSAEEGESFANPLSSGPMSEVSSGPSASKANTRKKAARKRRRKQTALRHWSNLNSRVTIIAENDRVRFIFDGHECSHSSVFDRDLSSTSHPDPPIAEFDDDCAALEAFNMTFYKPLNMVFCRTHKVCLPLASLTSHISSLSHTKTLPRMKGGCAKESFLSHVASAFDLPPSQTFYSQGSNTKQLPKPIPSMEEPRMYLQCPLCQTWLNQTGGRKGWKSHGVVRHLKRPGSECARLLEIPESERPALNECYGQRPCGTGPLGQESHIPFVEIVGWNPTAASSEVPPPIQESQNLVDPATQEYAKNLKWTEHFPPETAECLRFLCMLPNPSQSDVFNDPTPHQKRRKILERGLHEVHTFLKGYLQEANDFVDSCDPGFRLRLTEGSVSRVVVGDQLNNFFFHVEPSRTITPYLTTHSTVILLHMLSLCCSGTNSIMTLVSESQENSNYR